MPTTLTAGDIAIIGYDADNPDDFAFVVLRDIEAGTVINFTDNGWRAAGGFRANEGVYAYTAPTALAAGTVVHPTTDTAGSAPVFQAPNFALNAGGDQIIAYQGTAASPTFLYAVDLADGNAAFADDATDASTSALPPGLTLGTTAVALPADNGRYAGSTAGGRDALLSAIGNPASWSLDDGTRVGAPSYTHFTVGSGSLPTITIAATDATAGEGAPQDTATFTLTRTGDASQPLTVAYTVAAAARDGATPGTDFTGPNGGLSGNVTFAAGASTATLTFAALDDSAAEGREGFTVSLGAGAGYALGAAASAAAAIVDDEPGPTAPTGSIAILPRAESLAGSATTPVGTGSLDLVRLSTFAAGTGNAESVSFDPGTGQLYITNAGGNRIDIVRIGADGSLAKTGEIPLSGLTGYGAVNAVAVKNGVVAVAYENATRTDDGYVALFDAAGTLQTLVQVGPVPDQLTFTPDGTRLLVANEAEAASTTLNPNGSVSIISLAGGAAGATLASAVTFEALNGSEDALRAAGIAIYPGTAAAADIEPEYIAVSADGTRAYVTLQEVNAVAVIDLTDPAASRPIALLPLGGVDHALPGNAFDPNDQNGISLRNATITSVLQPDAIASYTVGGVRYFITANEGDGRVGTGFADQDVNRLSSAAVVLDPTAFPDAAALKASDLGRLNVLTKFGDTDGDGDLDQLYGFGGRGISIFRDNGDGTITKVRETGGEFEAITARDVPAIFNQNQGAGVPDNRSDDKGPEPEGVTIGVVDGRTYAFVGLERIGGVMVYDVTDPANARYVTYEPPANASEAGPEVVTFISAADSPTGRALVVSANEVGNTTVLYEAQGITRIHEVQGSGAASALVGRTVTLDAIVVGDFQNGDADGARNLGGFYLQEEGADQDGDAATSEGVFVYEGAGNFLSNVAEGDRVRVTGTVTEFNGETQITVTAVSGIQMMQAGALTAAQVKAQAVAVQLPAAGTVGTGATAQPNLEAYEGMLVTLPQTLTITEQFNLDRFNEIRLAAGGRVETFTNAYEPDAAAYAAYLAQSAARSIVYDDGLNSQNQPIGNLAGFGPYGTATAPRMGDTVTGLTGVLGYGPSNAYRVRAIEDGDNSFVRANPRTAAPDDTGGTLKVGSLNVLNYFKTLDSDGSATGVKTAIGLDPRGANTAAEFDRQTEKLVNTLIATGADVLGLTELENQFRPGDPGNALEYLVGQLNLKAGAGTYAYVNPGAQLDQGQFLGGDAIAVGFIYKPSKVSVAMNTTIEKLDDADVAAFDPALLQQSTIGAIFNGTNTSRASLAVTFHEIATGEDFTAVINHFKSKSGAGTGADADQGDGQGGWQQQRELAAKALAEWVALKPTGTQDGDTILLGDFNAYLKEDALDLVKAGGFTNLAEDRLADPYSYVFDAAYGALDHAFASASLNAQVTGVTEWHINADEADALDYNLDFSRDPSYFEAGVVARESDHDPVLVGLRLDQAAPRLVSATPSDNATAVAAGANIVLTFSEAVRAGSGSITLTDGAGDVRTIAVTDAAQVAISGTTVTINPTADLRPGAAYDVIVPAGALTDAAGNAFAGLAQDQLDFTTQGSTPMPYTLQILHASDWEAGLLATQRAANFAAIVDKLEDSTANSITLSTGDGWIPSPFFIAGADPQLAATYNGIYNQLYGLSGAAAYARLAPSVGRADVTIQNIIGVQAAVFGNHEFDSGPTEVANIIGANLGTAAGAADDTWVGAQFPYLSTNLNFSREAALSGLVNPNVSEAGFAATGPTSTQTGTGADKIAKSTILVENGERIAFIGATTQLEPLLTSLGNATVDGFNGQDNIQLLADQINAEVDRVLAANPGLNKVIVGTHLQQLANEQALAPLLRNVDVLIGGGSHTLLADGDDRLLPGDTSGGGYPQFYTNASGQTLALVNTASEYSYVGRLTVTFDDQGNILRDSVNPATSGAVAVDDATVAQLWGSTAAAFTPGSKGFLVREMIEGLDANNDGVQETVGIADIIRQQDGNILGRTSVYLEGRRGEVRTEETNLGDLTADANLWYAKQFDGAVTVSIKNGGGIRDSIGSFSTAGGSTAELPPAANAEAGKQAGDISQLDVTNSLRFNNNLALVTVTASELERILEHGVAAVAPGATPGQFTQIGGIRYAFDATKQSQTLDANGNVTREGQRIVSAAIVDENGFILDTLVQNGQLVGDANRSIRVVTLDFLATGTAAAPGLGGDNYPFPAYGENKVALRDAAPISLPDTETFAAQGSEQDALAEYLKAFYATNPYGQADTGPAGNTRIQNLALRADTVLQSGVAKTGTAGADTLQGTAFADLLRGGAGDDTIVNSAGNDILIGGQNADGSPGNDTLVFNSALADVTVTREGAFTIVTGPEGRDAIAGFERVQFTDTTVVLRDGAPGVDDLFYLAANKDVLRAGIDADAHYAAFGWREGRDPNALFSTNGYLAANPDVKAAGLNPLQHYLQTGAREGRDPSVAFDNEAYLARNPDVKAAGLNPLQHYLEFGQAEGRTTSEAIGRASDIRGGFDAEYYLLANADVARAASAAGGDSFAFARSHFESFGWKEGRDPNAVFDTKGYLAAYGDVKAAAINPLSHYDAFGWKEGRDPAADFDTSSYLSAYRDVAAAAVDPMQHYLQAGLYEGRSAFADGKFQVGGIG
ncbi:ExeM/NucH family extracellular endonuclease [Methylobacterium oxalidis]|uniref:ExeM/NucH family extracellular endonuclease n=1 Tax=Methylobacterium oxalidis TaxID=944322 RepID=UPI0033163FFB